MRAAGNERHETHHGDELPKHRALSEDRPRSPSSNTLAGRGVSRHEILAQAGNRSSWPWVNTYNASTLTPRSPIRPFDRNLAVQSTSPLGPSLRITRSCPRGVLGRRVATYAEP